MVKYNRDGDLIITCAKDTIPNLWRADTGERYVFTFDKLFLALDFSGTCVDGGVGV
jgi:hypothetical protein